jgi:two-component system, chemotaxis family, CheB/CheR fusion protein
MGKKKAPEDSAAPHEDVPEMVAWNGEPPVPSQTLLAAPRGLVEVDLAATPGAISNEEEIRSARDFSTAVVECVPIPLVVVERDCIVRTVNSAFRDLTHMHARDLAGRFLPDLFQQLWGADEFKEKLEALAASQTDAVLEFEHDSTTALRMTLLIRGRSLASGGSRVVLLTMEDITLRRQAVERIARQNVELEREVERTGKTLTEAQEELRGLTAYLLNAQEEERRHIARELHDDIAQRLSALRMEFDAARNQKEEKARIKALEAIHEQIDSLNTEVRSLSHRLHPAILDDLGLPAALKALVDDFHEREQMPASYIGSDVPETVPREAATALYRISQEALRNVAKHAGKTHVKVLLQGQDHMLRLEVRDFGTGFDRDGDVPRQGLGLVNMKERARIAGGKLSVQSGLGEGTTVSVEVPLNA